MNNLYLKALARVSDRHEAAETSRKADWQELGRVYTAWLVGDLQAADTEDIFIKAQ